jgi:nucleoside-diphosphate-sugar epimerase
VSRARSALAFEPRVALEEGLRRTVAAFLASPAT